MEDFENETFSDEELAEAAAAVEELLFLSGFYDDKFGIWASDDELDAWS